MFQLAYENKKIKKKTLTNKIKYLKLEINRIFYFLHNQKIYKCQKI